MLVHSSLYHALLAADMHRLFLVSAGRFKPTLTEQERPNSRTLGEAVYGGSRTAGQWGYADVVVAKNRTESGRGRPTARVSRRGLIL